MTLFTLYVLFSLHLALITTTHSLASTGNSHKRQRWRHNKNQRVRQRRGEVGKNESTYDLLVASKRTNLFWFSLWLGLRLVHNSLNRAGWLASLRSIDNLHTCGHRVLGVYFIYRFVNKYTLYTYIQDSFTTSLLIYFWFLLRILLRLQLHWMLGVWWSLECDRFLIDRSNLKAQAKLKPPRLHSVSFLIHGFNLFVCRSSYIYFIVAKKEKLSKVDKRRNLSAT